MTGNGAKLYQNLHGNSIRMARSLRWLFVLIDPRNRQVFIVVTSLFDGGELDRVNGDHLKLGAALFALHRLAYIDVIFHIERVIAFGANYRHVKTSGFLGKVVSDVAATFWL
jgi:hypothetical protein